jgi:hypothetical protein
MTETARLAWLEGRSPGLTDLRFDIGLGTTRIGRSPACPVVIADPMVSREHAEIRHEAGIFTLTDLGSRHGTWVNGQQIQQAPLSDGTVIRVGNSQLVFRVGHEALPTVMISAGGPQTVAAQPAVLPLSAPSGPPPAAAPNAATRGSDGKRVWLIGCVIVLILALCACALAVALSIATGLPHGLESAADRTLEGMSGGWLTIDARLPSCEASLFV